MGDKTNYTKVPNVKYKAKRKNKFGLRQTW